MPRHQKECLINFWKVRIGLVVLLLFCCCFFVIRRLFDFLICLKGKLPHLHTPLRGLIFLQECAK